MTRWTGEVPGPRWETPVPSGVAGTYGGLVRTWAARELGITYGRWQTHILDCALRHDRRGDLIHRIALFGTGRQNGKSVIVRGFYGWLMDEGREVGPFAEWRTILAAAHDARQARIIYRGVLRDLQGVARIRATHRLTEYYGIEAPNGLQLDTVTSDPGSSRGLSAGAVAWDEMLTQRDWRQWEALAPTQSAQRSPIMLLTSTAGHADSLILRTFYDRLVRIASGDEAPDRAFYGAWWESREPTAGLDWDEIRRANPALSDGRLTRDAITLDHRILPAESWQRERLNHFVDAVAAGALPPGVWAAIRTPAPLADLEGPYALGVDVQPGWERATLMVAARRPDGRVGTEVYRDLRAGEGGQLASSQITDAIAAFPDPLAAIVFDSVSGVAPALRRHAEETGLPYTELRPTHVVAACMDIVEMIQSGTLAADDPLLDAQIALAARRPVGQDGAFRFARTASLGPIDAVMSMTFAVHGIVSSGPAPQIF